MAGVIYKVKSLKDLKYNMDIFQISPEEAWNHIYSSKKLYLVQKSHWKMWKFRRYIYTRMNQLFSTVLDYKKSNKLPEGNIFKNKQLLKKLIKKALPRRKDIIRFIVKQKEYEKKYYFFKKEKKKKKFDQYTEIINLEKLILDPRQDKWFHPTFYKTTDGTSFIEEGIGWLIKYIR